MKHSNKIEFEIRGEYALFTDPITKPGGERCTLPVPTYEALKGILCSIYWTPSIIWIVDRVRVMNPIRTESMSVTRRKYRSGGSELSVYTYLRDVRYRVRAHFVWNRDYRDHIDVSDEDKYYQMTRRMLCKGGRRTVFLGTSECIAEILPCRFSEGGGSYDDIDLIDLGIMYHGITYPGNKGSEEMTVRVWQCVMENGIIRFPRPERCSFAYILPDKQKKEYKKSNELV